MEQRCSRSPRRGEPILSQDRGDESTGRALALGTGNVYGVQPVEIGRLSFVSAWLRLLSGTLFVVAVEAHTSYPTLRHHSTISGIAFLFMPMPAFLMASKTTKLLCNVLSAVMASC